MQFSIGTDTTLSVGEQNAAYLKLHPNMFNVPNFDYTPTFTDQTPAQQTVTNTPESNSQNYLILGGIGILAVIIIFLGKKG